MVKNAEFLGHINTNSYFFRHYDLSYFALNVNGKQIPTEGLALNMVHEKTSVMVYRTLLNASGIHHSNSGLHITHDIYIYINVYFMSHPDSGNIRVELKFCKPLPEPITCIFYLEFHNSFRIVYARKISTDF